LDGDQQKYRLGASTVYQVVQDQRDLATAGSAEVQALANYSHARIALDQALGNTLEVNKISLDEALSGTIQKQPAPPPATAPAKPLVGRTPWSAADALVGLMEPETKP
jgi:hypothetical protein